MKEKKNYITYLNVIAAMAVLIQHSSGYAQRVFRIGRAWRGVNLLTTLFHFAVPIFFMITGATLMDFSDRYSLKEYFVKRIQKTLIPFIIWSVIGFFYYGYVLQTLDVEKYFGPVEFFNGFMSTDYIAIYWFFPKLFLIYLAMPLFSAVEKSKRKAVFTYLVVGGFLISYIYPEIDSLFNLGLDQSVIIVPASKGLLIPLVGYLISEYEMPKKGRMAVYILSVMAFIAMLVITDQYSINAKANIDAVRGWNKPLTLVYSIGIFTWFRYNANSEMKGKIAKLFEWVAGYTFGIYLFHKPFMDTVKRGFGISAYSPFWVFGMPIVSLVVCVIVIYLVRKIPVVNKLLFP
ncbi:MAG: acyltransferase [Eubacterium sp.]|nr:acyltransferase [Eubacterium sp.]